MDRRAEREREIGTLHRTICVIVGIATLTFAAGARGADAKDANDPNSRGIDLGASDIGARIARLLLNKPEVPITLPKDMKALPAAPPLPAEGTMVIDRVCQMWSERHSPWLVVTFPAEPDRADEPERRVLPSELMERMEFLAGTKPGLRFRVSGETTIFERKAYLLVTSATALPNRPAATRPAGAPALTPARDLPADANADANSASPASAPAGDGERAPTSSDLLRELLGESIGKPIQTVPVEPDAPKAGSVAPEPTAVASVARGEIVADRLVRIMSDPKSRWWVAVFEADNNLQEPPMRLLPCGMLAKAIDLAGRARPGRTRVFRVSGRVTRYEGKRYLLLRKVLLELNLGQF